jgi:Tol biopolymer transport system component
MKNEQTETPAPASAPSLESETAKLLKDWSPAISEDTAKAEQQGEQVIDDTKTDEAVADIVAHESDEILAIEDAVNEAENTPEPKPSRGKRIIAWLKSSRGRWTVGIVVAFAIVACIVIPVARYYILNTLGVRAKSSVTVLDLSTQQPLKNTKVQIGNVEAVTDSEGFVMMSGLRLGKQKLTIDKLAFSSIDRSITIGWGSNPQGTVELTPTGAQYEFIVSDALTEKPMSKVELTSGQSNARTDDQGRAVLTIEEPGDKAFGVQFEAQGYRVDELMVEPEANKPTQVNLSPDAKHIFVSKRTGQYDMYSVYPDGKQESVLLKASGSEREADITLVPHPSEPIVAYVSTRANQTNADGYLLSSLLLVDAKSGETNHVVTTERISIVGWAGKRLIYLQISEGQSARNDERYKLMTHDTGTNVSKQIATADYINDVKLFGGQLFYAIGGGLQPEKAKLYRVNADGSNSQALLNQEVWSIVRVAVDELAFNTSDQQWYAYTQGASEVSKRSSSPGDTTSRVYIDSPDGKRTAWVDERDGKGVVLVYDFATKTEETITAEAGVGYPVSWLTNSAIVYRKSTPTETADYIVTTAAKQPRKLIDVTPTRGLGFGI